MATRGGRLATFVDVLKQAAGEWSGDRSPQIAAALAYYILFAIAPLLVLSTALASVFYGQAAGGRIVGIASAFVGPTIGAVLQEILSAASRPRSSWLATVISTIVLVVGATGAFASVQSALNQIWEVEPRPDRGVWGLIRDRVPTFVLLVLVAALLVVSLALTTALSGITKAVGGTGLAATIVAQALNLLLFVAVLSVLFAFVYKVLPDARIGWRDVWIGAVVTAVLFGVGQLLIGVYLSYATFGSAYGAAGSFVALLVWLDFSGQAFLFGAELTQVEAARRGSHIEPSRNARRLQEPCAPPRDEGRPMRPAHQ